MDSEADILGSQLWIGSQWIRFKVRDDVSSSMTETSVSLEMRSVVMYPYRAVMHPACDDIIRELL
jgi:hypothetical protein